MLVHVPRSPRGGSEKDQSVFRAALAAFLGTGLGRQAAVHRATRLVRDTTPDFDPALPPDFFD